MSHTLLVGLAVLGVVAALAVLAMRWTLEASYRDVEITLDGPDWEMLAIREGEDPLRLFAQAREHGATAVAVYERTLESMAAQGEVAYRSGGQLISDARVGPVAPAFHDMLAAGVVRSGSVYVAASPEMLGFLHTAFTELLGPAHARRTHGVLEVDGIVDELQEAPLGYLPQDLDRYARLGLRTVLRLRNYPGMTAAGLRAKIARLARFSRGSPAVFDKTEVLGFEGLLDETAEALRAAAIPYGRIEVFSAKRKQRGEDYLAARMRPDVIRLFSLTAEELLGLTPASVRDKFVLAARERNIRILYLRPILPTAGIVGTAANLQFLDHLTADLVHFGLRPGAARPLPVLRLPPFLTYPVVLGALAAMGLALILVGRAAGVAVPERVVWFLIGLGVLMTAAAVLTGSVTLWRKLLALGTASSVPVLAIASTVPRGGGRPVAASLRALWAASAISIAGGLLVAALLTGWEFMMAADVFVGVKLAHLIPAGLIAVVLATAERPPRHWREGAAQLWAWSSRPLLVRYAIAAVVAGVAVVVLLARSGNFGLPVFALEERLRDVMEQVFVVRPRTKEYLIGHPALLLAAAAAALRWRLGVIPLAAVGAIGQAGIINSFSHIHTPLLYTAWRTANALVLGSVLGAVILVVLLRAFAAVNIRLGVPSPPPHR